MRKEFSGNDCPLKVWSMLFTLADPNPSHVAKASEKRHY